jgi:hypothetical protein
LLDAATTAAIVIDYAAAIVIDYAAIVIDYVDHIDHIVVDYIVKITLSITLLISECELLLLTFSDGTIS